MSAPELAPEFAEIERLWNEVADAPPEERARLLAAASEDVRREVKSLLAADSAAGDFLDAPARRSTLEQGTRIGPYEIVSLLGSGGMGEVYRARDPRLGRDVALKLLAPDRWDSPTAAARFAREARAASALNHPNIVHLYDVATEPTPFIAMELVEGETLRQRLRAGADLPSLLRALTGAARGLARAHAAGIVHRDLKPENIVITPDGEAKLLDFGLAKVTDVARAGGEQSLVTTRAGLVVGTVGYMSPEQAQGERIDRRSDVFSFGCILFEVAVGRRPFESDSLIDTLHKIVHAPVPSMRQRNAALPRRLQTLVERCLEKKPEARFQSMEDVALALEELLRRDARALTRRRTSRWPRALAAAAIAAVCTLTLRSSVPLRASDPVAVMPFAATRAADAYLGDGIAAGIAERLASIDRLEVMPSETVREFVAQRRPLHARFVVAGRVDRRGERLHVTATIGDETHRFAGALSELPRLERDVAQAVARALGSELAHGDDRALVRADTTSPRAYDAFLRARFEWNRWTDEGWRKAIEHFEEATIADPLFAAAYAGLSDTYAQLALYDSMPPSETWPKAKAAALKALELDPNLGEAHMSLAVVRTWYEWDLAAAEPGYRRAIAVSRRSPEARLAYALHLGVAGRAAEGVREAQRAVELNPISAIAHRTLADLLQIVGDHQRYAAHARRFAGLHPDDPIVHYHLALSAQFLGREAEAFQHIRRYDALYGATPAQLAAHEEAFRRGGMRAYWRAVARADEAAGHAPIVVAIAWALAGDADRTLAAIERGIDRRDAFILWARTYPMFAFLRDDPRYQALMARLSPRSS